jgi:UDP-glucose-4-epimerase GalE
MKVIVTGAAGYIGGQTLLQLTDAGHDVLAIDRVMPPGNLMTVPCSWHTGDFASDMSLDAIKLFCPDAIIHCAGASLVGPSLTNPEEYYNNNFVKTKILLDYLVSNHYKQVRFIFSSSAATYGNPIMNPCQEVDPAEPISPYGESKLMIEWMLKSYHRAYGLDYVAFRYFNACGADSLARHGQTSGATHIIARVLEALRDQSGQFVLNGTNFETEDGTCIRDYVHVEDLAAAHVMAMDRSIPTDVYNLGTNQGYSNLQIIQGAIGLTKQDLEYNVGPQRPGDPAMLTANADKFIGVSGWQPRYGLEDMIDHAWAWYNR